MRILFVSVLSVTEKDNKKRVLLFCLEWGALIYLFSLFSLLFIFYYYPSLRRSLLLPR